MRVLRITLLLLVSGCVPRNSIVPQRGPAKDCLLGGKAYAEERPWFAPDTAQFFGTRYLKFGPTRILDLAYINQHMERAGTHADAQVALYVARDRTADPLDPPHSMYVPVAAGCVIQTYVGPHNCQILDCPPILQGPRPASGP